MNGLVVVAMKSRTGVGIVVHKSEAGEYNVIIDDFTTGAKTAKPSFVLKNIKLLEKIVESASHTIERRGVAVEEFHQYDA
jgi:hypothetical protein